MQESRREHSRSWAHSKQDGCEEVPEIRQIAASIEAFGFNVPVLVDSNLKVDAGHGRLLACPQLGRESVPTICLEHLSEAQARAFMIADNRLTEISTRDDHLLAAQLKTLSELELDFDLEATGFAMGEIDVLIEGLSGPQDDPADVLQEAPDREPTTRAGDLWLP
jgi:ParB-like chromosome segregation protein Spo0J